MPASTLLDALQLEFPCAWIDQALTATQADLTLATTAPTAACPQCQTASQRVHSRYRRTVRDVPLGGRAVCLHLRLRKFYCDNPACAQVIFAERLAPWLAPYARRTKRLEQDLAAFGCENGGEGGARQAARLRLGRWSPNTLLRLVRRLPEALPTAPRVLGVDDWAKRRGQTYGTILCDLEQHRVIELLADREADTLAAWLQAHPGVEVICRDRAGAYADGARRGAPEAVQVADRFHLLVNASEAVQRVVDRHRDRLTVQVQEVISPTTPKPDSARRAYQSRGLPRPAPRPSQVQAHRELKRRQRAERWDQARALIAQGLSRQAVCQQMRIGKRTLRRILQTEGCPEHAATWRTLRVFTDEVTRRWQAGEHNGRALYDRIRAQGYRGSYQLLLRFLQPLRQKQLEIDEAPHPVVQPPDPPAAPRVRTVERRLAPRLVARCLAGNPPPNSEVDQQRVAQLCETMPELAAARDLATTFRALITEHQRDQLAVWLERAASSCLVEFQAFAASLERDRAAVELAIASQWSSGQVEGQINRLKLIKRMMYGRGKLDLLRKRVVYGSAAIT